MPRTSARRLSFRAICISVAAFTTVVVTAGVAWAAYTDNMYPTQYLTVGCFSVSGPSQTGFCRTDNSALTYYMDSSGSNALEAADRAVVNDVMSHQYNPTDLSVTYDSTPVFSGSAETDVVYEESGVGLPASLDGYTFCNNAANSIQCDQQYIRIRGGGHYEKGLVCHETGHAVGLTHGNVASPQKRNDDNRLGCMQTPTDADEVLGANNIENINATY